MKSYVKKLRAFKNLFVGDDIQKAEGILCVSSTFDSMLKFAKLLVTYTLFLRGIWTEIKNNCKHVDTITESNWGDHDKRMCVYDLSILFGV